MTKPDSLRKAAWERADSEARADRALYDLQAAADALIRTSDVRRVVDMIYAMDVSAMTDEQFAGLQLAITQTVQLLAVCPDDQRRPLIQRLFVALDGVEQGMAPDPAKRPTIEELQRFVSERLP